MDEFTVSDLVRITKMKSRWVQALAETDIIRPIAQTDRAGSGVHRKFEKHEAIIACVVATFARRKMTVGELKKIANNIRNWLDEWGGDEFLSDIGEGRPVFLVITWFGAEAQFLYIRKPPEGLPEPRMSHVFQGIEDGDGIADVIYLTKILKDVV